eukprot:m.88106 g.88106  ORF g.88106 m.88106 type:complete len:487 (-) comp15165_c0_seq1:225-1685(-)
MGLGSVLGGLADVVAVVAISFCGGIMNRLRGSGGNFAQPTDLGYWEAAAYSRGLEALPLAALVRLLTRDLPSAAVLLLSVWASLLIGWGTYFDLGEPGGYTARIGEYDWLVGREMPGWDFDRRWVRKYPSMMLRGLQWTLPAGYLLAHRGGGWTFALSGALMPVAYTLASHTGIRENDDGFMFDAGIAWAESVWGMWLWFVVLVSLLAKPHRWRGAHFVRPFEGNVASALFEAFVLLVQATNIGSCVYYSHIQQCDDRNWQQTYVGLLFVTGVQFVSHVVVLIVRNCCVHRSVDLEPFDENEESTSSSSVGGGGGGGYSSRFSQGSRNGLQVQVENDPERMPLLFDVPPPTEAVRAPSSPLSSSSSPSSPRRGGGGHRAGKSVRSVFYPPGVAPFRQLHALVRLVILLAVLLGTVMLFVAIGWNGSGDRYCQSINLLDPTGTLLRNFCVSDDTLDAAGCANILPASACWELVITDVPDSCILPLGG